MSEVQEVGVSSQALGTASGSDEGQVQRTWCTLAYRHETVGHSVSVSSMPQSARQRILTYPQLKPEKGVPWTRQYLSRLEAAGKFPRRVQLGPNTVAWVEAEIDEWLAGRAAEREAA
jgi:prophage regulatory protein